MAKTDQTLLYFGGMSGGKARRSRSRSTGSKAGKRGKGSKVAGKGKSKSKSKSRVGPYQTKGKDGKVYYFTSSGKRTKGPTKDKGVKKTGRRKRRSASRPKV
jgi:hypothetical protein